MARFLCNLLTLKLCCVLNYQGLIQTLHWNISEACLLAILTLLYFQIIPARSFANVNITFTPLPTEVVKEEMDCVGFAIAHMSIDKVCLSVCSKRYFEQFYYCF